MSQTTGTGLTIDSPPIASAQVCYLVDDEKFIAAVRDALNQA